jgi:2-succinyl-5-enolpyruvyl-6-hydroxy-3-cyclohexene-1-carboxylate synthase
MTVAADAQASLCTALVDEWARGGLTDAVVCPGSRSTPMALALLRHGGFRVSVRLDERSAGFFALGLALSSGRAVVVLTTSGTAAAELHAAVVEADLARVPLIVCTADRPPELQQVGAPQTIDQQRLYGASVRYFADPGVAATDTSGTWRSLASRLIAEATSGPLGPGPVHVNLPFREPLLGEASEVPPASVLRASGHHRVTTGGLLGEDALEELADEFAGLGRGLVVAGASRFGSAGAVELARRLSWPLLADPRSGARRPYDGVATVAAADALLRTQWAATVVPEVVVHCGEAWASKVLGGWLASVDRQVGFDADWAWRDPNRRLRLVVRAALDPATAAAVGPATRGQSDWAEAWSRAEEAAQAAIDEALRAITSRAASEPAVARDLFSWLPPGSSLLASSSMPVRDLEWFAAARNDPPAVFANRGANGIDGVVSTLLGVAADGGLTYGLVGDLAVLHDSSALVRARGAPPTPAVVVVLDNEGGGIFSFLPQAGVLTNEEFETLFGTPQEQDVLEVVRGFGWEGQEVRLRDELVPALEKATADALASAGPSFVVVRTERASNVAVHRAIEEAVADAVG